MCSNRINVQTIVTYPSLIEDRKNFLVGSFQSHLPVERLACGRSLSLSLALYRSLHEGRRGGSPGPGPNG